MTPFPTPELDRILQERNLQQERERLSLLEKTREWLDLHATEYEIDRAYLFGSITRSGKFHPRSDVDIAVESISSEHHFIAISKLTEYLERDVDIILLKNCHFAHRIREEGLLWTRENSLS
jgi:predicted nucleotidyltransferase